MTTLSSYNSAVTKSLNISLDNSGEYSLTDIAGNIISVTSNTKVYNQGTVWVKTTLADVTISWKQYYDYDPYSQTFDKHSSIIQSVNGQTVFDYQDIPGLYTDLSRYTGVAFMAAVFADNDMIFGGLLADKIYGFAGNDYIYGGAGNDTVNGGTGNDEIDFGSGTDTAMYSGNRASYTISKTSTDWTVSSKAEGVDTLTNVERLKFADTAIAFDTSGVGGQAYRVYKAAFNRTPDVGGLGFWISGMDGGESLNAVAQGFVNSAEFKSVYGASPTNAQIVTRLYDNVLGRAADSGGYNYWLGILDSGQASVAGVLASFSESPENQAAVIGVIGNGILYTPYG